MEGRVYCFYRPVGSVGNLKGSQAWVDDDFEVGQQRIIQPAVAHSSYYITIRLEVKFFEKLLTVCFLSIVLQYSPKSEGMKNILFLDVVHMQIQPPVSKRCVIHLC